MTANRGIPPARADTEQALRESEARYRALVETSPDAIMLLSEGRIAFVNSAGARLYGAARPEDLVGTPIVDHVHPAYREMVAARVRKLMQGQTVPAAVILQQRLDRSTFYGEVVSAPFQVEARPGALTVVRDVSERRRVEEEIRTLNTGLEARVQRRTRQLEDANRELEAFSYSVSHDLRAPLRAIHGFSELLARNHAGALDDKALHYLERVQEAARRMGLLIDDLLNLSRVSRAPVTPAALDLSGIAALVVEDLRAGEPQRAVEVAIAPGLRAHGDPALMRLVLQNLIENAWKFTRRREGARIEVGEEHEAGERRYYVRDNGAGFNMRLVDKLFGAFQRLHDPKDYPGTGIGLVTVQRVIARHGGRVWAQAGEGRGATFYFTLDEGGPWDKN